VAGGFDPALGDEQTKLTGIDEAARAGNQGALRQYLQDTDAAVQAAAFDALAAKNQHSAVQDLLAIIRDTKQLARVQALQLLDTSPQVDEQTVLAALRNALVDPDPLLSQYALEALAARDASTASSTPAGAGSQSPFSSSGAPGDTAGPQGPFMSSGAPGGTAGPQGPLSSSGALADTVGPQAVVPTRGEAKGLDPALEDQQTKLEGIDEAARAGNLDALRHYLQDTDAAVQIAAFEALSARDEHSATEDLLAIIRDTKQLTRGQALRLLDSSPHVDEQTARAALRNATVDPDPLLRQYALKALAVRDAGGNKR
jgi:HEAT repeat protein